MPDEANSHWLSILLQLTEGQTWLKQHLNITPTSSWSIDPFGHSPTLPYILKKSGFQNHLIQRTHYSVKKELALKRQLEFHWRQIWGNINITYSFTFTIIKFFFIFVYFRYHRQHQPLYTHDAILFL